VLRCGGRSAAFLAYWWRPGVSAPWRRVGRAAP